MIRAYCLLAAAATLLNGSMIAPWIDDIQSATDASRPAAFGSPVAFGVDAEKGRDGLFRVMGRGDGVSVRFVIDTGASVTVLTARDADALRVAPSPGRDATILRTAGGAAAVRWRRLEQLDIAGAHLTGLDVVVANGLEHSLLGQDILSRLGTVTMTGERLEIRPPRA